MYSLSILRMRLLRFLGLDSGVLTVAADALELNQILKPLFFVTAAILHTKVSRKHTKVLR